MNLVGVTLYYWCHILDIKAAGIRLRTLIILTLEPRAKCHGYSVFSYMHTDN